MSRWQPTASPTIWNATLSYLHFNRDTAAPPMSLPDLSWFHHPKPHHRTLATLLDLSPAFDRVSHSKLFGIFRDLGLPPALAQFYKGFFTGRNFRVRVGTTLNSATCGVPQGTCSGPVPFVLYTESLLRQLMPLLKTHNVQAGMFADDHIVWKTGPDVELLTAALTTITAAITS